MNIEGIAGEAAMKLVTGQYVSPRVAVKANEENYRLIKIAVEKAYLQGKQDQLAYDKTVESCMKE